MKSAQLAGMIFRKLPGNPPGARPTLQRPAQRFEVRRLDFCYATAKSS